VSKNEILIGTIQDLSGPLAGYGKQLRNGMQLRIEELNEQGSIHGRQAQAGDRGRRLRPEEVGAGSPEAGEPGQDLHHGRPHRHGAEHGRHAGAVREERDQLLPAHRRRARCTSPSTGSSSSFAATYFDQMRAAVPKMVKEKNVKQGLHDLPGR